MKFSVLIANYNNAGFLPIAVDSILKQSYTDWEIILVDDCSTDHFNEVIGKYKSEERIKVFSNKKNMGCGYTKALCASLATGQIAGFLDPDDALHPEAIRSMIEAHRYKISCSMIYSTHYICDENLDVKRIADNTKILPAGIPYLLLSDGTVHHFVSFKTVAYRKTEGINQHWKKAVDQDLYYKLEEVGDAFFINLPLYYYRVHKNGISNGGKESQALCIHYKIIEEACKRRIGKLDSNNTQDTEWIKIYAKRKNKIKIMRRLLERKWVNAALAIGAFTLTGGTNDMIEYLRKVQKNGFQVFKRTLTQNNEIKL